MVEKRITVSAIEEKAIYMLKCLASNEASIRFVGHLAITTVIQMGCVYFVLMHCGTTVSNSDIMARCLDKYIVHLGKIVFLGN